MTRKKKNTVWEWGEAGRMGGEKWTAEGNLVGGLEGRVKRRNVRKEWDTIPGRENERL